MARAINYLQRIPFIRISSLFLLGMLLNHYLQIKILWIGIPSIVVILILIAVWSDKHFSGAKILNVFTALAILLSGMFYTCLLEKQPASFNKKDYYLAELCQKPIEKTNSFQTILKLQNRNNSTSEKVIGYFSKDNFDTTLVAGDQLILFAKLQEISNMGNPFEFDYKTMMHHKGIDYSIYLKPETYKKTGIQINRLTYRAEHVRDQLVQVLEKTNIGKEEKAVIAALTLGDRTELDPETLHYFVNTGTIHVLSVSGLHVALIYLILSFLFSGIKNGKIGWIIYPVLLISFLWIYAFITGFSPPIQRSTIMFSFVIIGNIIRRPINIFNSLSASALVLVLLDPNVLFDIGFQLSYLAIFGIVLLQPPLEKLVQYKNKIMKWGWTLLTVSLSAQLMAFPLSILYFNQFPNLFWLSNFIAIPGTTALMWLTFAFFAFSPFTAISSFLALTIQFTTAQMLTVLKWMSELPLAVTQGIVWSSFQTLIVYGVIISFIIYSFSKRKTGLFAALILYIGFQTSILWQKYTLFNQRQIYVFNSKSNLVQFINGRNSYVVSLGSKAITEQEKDMIHHVCNHLKLKDPKFIQTFDNKLNKQDLKVNGNSLQFLNCAINCSNPLRVKIQAFNYNKFRIENSQLLKSGMLNESEIKPVRSNANEFSINIKNKFTKTVNIVL